MSSAFTSSRGFELGPYAAGGTFFHVASVGRRAGRASLGNGVKVQVVWAERNPGSASAAAMAKLLCVANLSQLIHRGVGQVHLRVVSD